MNKQLKIIGLSIKENFGALKATELAFNEEFKLTMIKGVVGAGKTTLNKALRLTTQGSGALVDKELYGNNVHLETQICDGDQNIFVCCKSKEDGSLEYSLYTLDANGKKVNSVVSDGVKLSPASYLKSIQTKLTWRLDELTSENMTTQRNILLELYQNQLEQHGVIFDKKHPNYVDGVIDQIEKAKDRRNFLDMKRKEVGGIADDLKKKGVSTDERKEIRDVLKIQENISSINSRISLAKENVKTNREAELNKLKLAGSDIATKIRIENDKIKVENKTIIEYNSKIAIREQNMEGWCNELSTTLNKIFESPEKTASIVSSVRKDIVFEEKKILKKEVEYNEKGSCISIKDAQFPGELNALLNSYHLAVQDYVIKARTPEDEVDTTELEKEYAVEYTRLESAKNWNETAKAVNSYIDWSEQNSLVQSLNHDYYKKLALVNTGVAGLSIESVSVEDSDKYEICLMYNGVYDKEYFCNQDLKPRKLSSYSDTQKPMICLLIQSYLLSKKEKSLPYLWIDQVPIDRKTKELLDKMSEELGLWLFVNWTGDFEKEALSDGEILIENGEIFFKE